MWVGLTILSLLQTIEDMIATTIDVATYHPAYEVSSHLTMDGLLYLFSVGYGTN